MWVRKKVINNLLDQQAKLALSLSKHEKYIKYISHDIVDDRRRILSLEEKLRNDEPDNND